VTLVCDTSGLLAALDHDDPDHSACAAVLLEHPGLFVLSPLVLAELAHLVRTRLGAGAARTMADDVANGAYELAALTASDVRKAVAVDRAYVDLGVGLADASSVVVAARHATLEILTLDHRHFRALVPLQGGAFRLLPADR